VRSKGSDLIDREDHDSFALEAVSQVVAGAMDASVNDDDQIRIAGRDIVPPGSFDG
jgi:hypothetical protein